MEAAAIGENARYAGSKPSAVDSVNGAHYVSIISGKRLCLALGPFESHSVALTWVDAVRDHVRQAGYRDWPLAFGTSRVRDREDAPIGKFNKALGL